MPAYISLINWTDQGVRSAKETINWAHTVEQSLQAAGGKKIAIWWTMGQYDIVLALEAPDDETATRFLVSLGMMGNIRTNTLRCFTEDETRRILQGV